MVGAIHGTSWRLGSIATTEAQTRNNKMKRNLLTLLAAGAISVNGLILAQANDEGPAAGPGWHGHGHGPLAHITESLNLTADQKGKVQPILDQAKPQLAAIHQDAMQKSKAVMDSTMSQIRPLLTPDQQKKLDEIQKAHQDLHNAMKELHDAQAK
jgi:periplasmic protein CpxP/Spy